MKKAIIFYFLLFGLGHVYGQSLQLQTIDLNAMSTFRPQAGNWRIVGDVTINPMVDIHSEPAVLTPSTFGKKNKKEPTQTPVPAQKAVTFAEGSGILLNINTESQKDHLLTSFDHGDIELEFEVMLPKGSNSGVYLQGRYEVQLLDSWGVLNPTFSDIGGIYRNWENTPGKIYMGKAPTSNPAKAPGLWQKFRISFQAPKFDSNGKKTSNARFTYVDLNGVRIHENLEVPLPTGGPIENNEKPTGPLMIQGDHGPVAFRNIRYRLLKENPITLTDISYKTYYGKFRSKDDYQNLKPSSTGTLPALTVEIFEKENEFAAIYTGNITIPEDDEYSFNIRFSGGGNLIIDGKSILDYPKADGWMETIKTINLKKGTYTFEVHNFKDVSWQPPLLGIWVESKGFHPKSLHAFESYPPIENPSGPILLHPGQSPRLLRAFLDFNGDRSKRLTHTIGVGDPSGVHYVYDLNAGNLVCAWRGAFVDATPMWHDRGDGSFKPRGAAQYLFTTPSLSVLQTDTASFPEKVSTDFHSTGYRIDEKSERPIFMYQYKDVNIEDSFFPDEKNTMLIHEVKTNKLLPNGYYKMAEGKSIIAISPGLFAVDKQYYITVDEALKPKIRSINGKSELIVPIEGLVVKYSVIW